MIILKLDDSEDQIVERILSMLSSEDEDIYKMACLKNTTLTFSQLEIRPHEKKVLRNGIEIRLTRHEYGILTYLATYPGQVFSKEQIFEAVWDEESNSCLSVVSNTISHLRAKIEPDKAHPVYIKTVYDGYKFEKDIT